MSQREQFMAQIEAVFGTDPITDDCITVTAEPEFYIRDKTPIVVISGTPHTDQLVFAVQNPRGDMITILAIDHCWADRVEYRSFKMERCRRTKKGRRVYLNGRCECILFNDSTLCLVEIKENLSGSSAKENIKKALCQIENTYLNLTKPIQAAGFDILDFDVEAYVSLEHISPKIISGMQARTDDFDEEYGIFLFFEQQKTF